MLRLIASALLSVLPTYPFPFLELLTIIEMFSGLPWPALLLLLAVVP